MFEPIVNVVNKHQVLVLGCHCDDIELGCGGTLYKHRNDWDIHCVIFSQHDPAKKALNLKSQSIDALEILGVKQKKYYAFDTNDFWKDRQRIWSALKELELIIKPDIVITHAPDSHQDHVTLYEETCRNFKSCTVLGYVPTIRNEIHFRWDHFEILSDEDVNSKIKCLSKFKEYQNKVYFLPENIISQMRVYAMKLEVSGFAEAFKTIKSVR